MGRERRAHGRAGRRCDAAGSPLTRVEPEPAGRRPSLGEVARLFLTLGTIGFGGPAAHVALMEDEVVRRRRWMTREAYLWSMAAMGFGLSALLLATFYAIRFFPSGAINLAHREYWLAPERGTETCEAIFHFGIWLVSLMAALQVGVNLLVVSANISQPAKLSSHVWLLLASFIVGVLLWIVALIRRFSQAPP